jgi:hypothetical protein
MSERSKAILFGIGAVGGAWFTIQNLPPLFAGGDFLGAILPNLIFILTMVLVVSYCVYYSVPYWFNLIKSKFSGAESSENIDAEVAADTGETVEPADVAVTSELPKTIEPAEAEEVSETAEISETADSNVAN